MPFKRTATIAGAGLSLAAWLAGAATSVERVSVQDTPAKPAAVDARGAELAKEVARLHERLRPSVEPHQPGRDLFSFVAPKPRAAAPTTGLLRPAALSEAAPVAPAPPPFKLAGIAEDSGPEGVVRTAIISGRGQLFLAKEGDSVADRYRVTKISAEVIELADLDAGTVLRLALK